MKSLPSLCAAMNRHLMNQSAKPEQTLNRNMQRSPNLMKPLKVNMPEWTSPFVWSRLIRSALVGTMALTMMASTPALASNLTYNFSGTSAGNFGKSTSVEPVTTIGADDVNRDLSKNSAFVPPSFGSPQADILGTGELLTPDISGVPPMFPHSTQANYGQTVTSNGTAAGNADIVMPPDAEGTTVSSAPIYAEASANQTSDTDSLGGYTGGGSEAAYGSGYTPASGMKYSDGSIGTLALTTTTRPSARSTWAWKRLLTN